MSTCKNLTVKTVPQRPPPAQHIYGTAEAVPFV